MTALSATAPAAGPGVALAHGIHYAIVAAGVVGILALLLPQLHGRLVGPRRHGDRAPRDVHEARVLLLRAEIASGTLGTAVRDRPQTLRPLVPEPLLPFPARTLLPAAFVASTAAAGVHAAMAPSHLEHETASGVFFLAAAAFQVVWAAGSVLGISRQGVLAGVVVNVVFVGLWGVTRTVGLPGLPPEAVGPWDVACVAWELVVVVTCLRLLGTGPGSGRLASWHRWDGRVVALAVGSAALLAALSFGGFSG